MSARENPQGGAGENGKPTNRFGMSSEIPSDREFSPEGNYPDQISRPEDPGTGRAPQLDLSFDELMAIPVRRTKPVTNGDKFGTVFGLERWGAIRDAAESVSLESQRITHKGTQGLALSAMIAIPAWLMSLDTLLRLALLAGGVSLLILITATVFFVFVPSWIDRVTPRNPWLGTQSTRTYRRTLEWANAWLSSADRGDRDAMYPEVEAQVDLATNLVDRAIALEMQIRADGAATGYGWDSPASLELKAIQSDQEGVLRAIVRLANDETAKLDVIRGQGHSHSQVNEARHAGILDTLVPKT